MSVKDHAEKIFRRRFTFVLVFLLLSGTGLLLLTDSKPVYTYSALIEIRLHPDQTMPSSGELAGFIAGTEAARLGVVCSPRVIETAALFLWDKPDFFPQFDLRGEPAGESWESFIGHVRASVDLTSPSRDRSVLCARASDGRAAGAIVRAVAAALVQHLVKTSGEAEPEGDRTSRDRQAALAVSDPRVTREAEPREDGRSGKDVAAVLLASFVLSAAITIVREALARRRRGEETSPAANLDYEIIGRIPSVASASGILEVASDEKVGAALGRLCDRVAAWSPQLRVTWVASARRWEGKTTVAVALAKRLAAGGSRVLLVDANVHDPALQHVFGYDNQYGLTTVLLGHAKAAIEVEKMRTGKERGMTLADMVVSTRIDNLSVLPSGPPPIDPAFRPLAGDMGAILRDAMTFADVVICDGPTLPRRSEVERLEGVLTNLVVVVAQGRSVELDVVSTNYVFSDVRRNVIGAVLNFDGQEMSAIEENQPAGTTTQER